MDDWLQFSMKKVLLFTDKLGSGGAQRQLVGLAILLKQCNFNVVMLDYWDATFYDAILEKYGIEFKHAYTKGKMNIIRMVKREIERFQPDVLISYMEHPSIVACVCKRLCHHKFKLIVSERNTTQQNDFRTYLRFNLFRIADAVVPNSHAQENFILRNYSFLKNRTICITNFIDTSFFEPSNEPTKRTCFRFLVVGRIVEQKNPFRFIQALKIVSSYSTRPFHVDWYGDPFPDDYRFQCEDLARRLGIEHLITFYPAKSNILSEYQNSDAFILPSIYEGFPNVLCEAMSCGLPILAGNICDNGNIMNNGANGYLFDPLSPDDMASKLMNMLNLGLDAMQTMSKESRRIALSKFSKEEFLNQYIELLED